MTFEPRDPDYVKKVTDSFALQTTMESLKMNLQKVQPGYVEIMHTKHDSLVQQMGFVHGGVLTSGIDSACGYAALSLAPKECEVLTVEFKTSFIAPAAYDRILMVGTVIKPGRRAIFTEGEAFGLDGEDRVLLAKMSATMTYIDIP